jgi:hypothetical protein
VRTAKPGAGRLQSECTIEYQTFGLGYLIPTIVALSSPFPMIMETHPDGSNLSKSNHEHTFFARRHQKSLQKKPQCWLPSIVSNKRLHGLQNKIHLGCRIIHLTRVQRQKKSRQCRNCQNYISHFLIYTCLERVTHRLEHATDSREDPQITYVVRLQKCSEKDRTSRNRSRSFYRSRCLRSRRRSKRKNKETGTFSTEMQITVFLHIADHQINTNH